MVNLLFLDRRNRTTRPSWNHREQTHTPRFLLGPLLESPGMWHLPHNMWMYIPRKLKTVSRVSWDKMEERGKYSHVFLIGGDSFYCIVLAIIACLTPGFVPVFLCIKDWGDIQEVVFSVQFSCSVVFNSLRTHGPQPPCPSPTPEVYPNSCSLSRWCHPTISFFVVPSSSCL